MDILSSGLFEVRMTLCLKGQQERRKVKWTLIPAILSIIVLTSMALGILQRSRTIGGSGTVKAIGVGVYWDNDCTSQVSSINFGMVEPDSVNNVTVYIKNESNAPVTLSLQTENWNPTNASNYMTLSWDYGGQEIGVNEVVQVMLSLSVSSSIEGITGFTFDIIIVGTG